MLASTFVGSPAAPFTTAGSLATKTTLDLPLDASLSTMMSSRPATPTSAV
jgi:hypothetical protein